MIKSITRMILAMGIFMLMSECAFSQFTLSAELRPRFEYRNGYKRLPDTLSEFASFVSQRSRIYFEYNNGKIKSKISFQDVHVWGNKRLKTDTTTTGLYEAWVEIPICDSLTLKVGKQEILYDNERLLSGCNWAQIGLTHNAAMLKYRKNGLQIDFTGAFNQSTETIFGTDYSKFPNNYKTLNILWVSKQITPQFKASLLGIADGYQKLHTTNTVYLRATYGGILEYNKENKCALALRRFYQDGSMQTGQRISAFYFSTDLSFMLTRKFTLWPGMQISSGTGDANGSDYKNTFNTLLWLRAQVSGNMDYFSNPFTATKGAGLLDPYLNMIYKLNEKGFFRLDLHYFALKNRYIVNVSPIEKTLGSEADLSFTYNFTGELSLMAGFSGNVATKSMEVIVGGNSIYPGGWGFAMLTFKPVFLKTEKK